MEKISNLFEDFLILIAQFAFWAYVLALAFVVMGGLALPLAAQALEWLQDGVASPRDGFWLYALYDCGVGWCRPEFVAPQTGWESIGSSTGSWICTLRSTVL